jgi:ketosteroid isomerase-like protein
MTREDTLLLMQRHVAAWNAHDAELLLSLMTEDCIFDAATGNAPHGRRIIGHVDLKSAFEAIWTAVKDARWDDAAHLVQGDRGVTTWTFRGTKDDGSPIEVRGLDLLTFRDGRICQKDTYRKAVSA